MPKGPEQYTPPEARMEPDLSALSESFTEKRNSRRLELLQKILPPSVDTQRILDFLGGDTVTLVRQRMQEFPLILGGTEIEILGKNLREQVRPVLSQQFGDDSYLRDGEFLSDESETLDMEMWDKQTVLQKTYWNNFCILLGDHLGLLRMNALSYKLVDEPSGPIATVIQRMIETDIERRLADIEKELRETPDWLARKGLPKKGPKPKSELDEKIGRAIISLENDKVKELVDKGVHHKIAEARVLADSTKPVELTPENIAYVEKRLEEMRITFPQIQEEYERLKPLIGEIIREILNETSLDHIMQVRKFGMKK
ncbi:MAG: hypothetical protein Q7K54_02325 [Candidatus Parcubacteria bacterium]|nr:hypothetical protein [Candidatus Parcubacteria bacterium]